MKWEAPTFVEINMSAEIGGYQSDFGDREPVVPVAPLAQAHGTQPAERAADAARR